jgi:hypothetical protein
MFITPVTNSNTALATSSAIDSRSIAWAGDAIGGQANSRGMTDHSLASRNGIATRPTLTCSPWVIAYRNVRLVGQSNTSGRSAPGSTIALPRRSGW